jgi:acyl-CoA hydrolase
VRVVLVAEPTDDGVVYPGSTIANDDELVTGPRPDDAVVIGLVDANQPRLRGHTYSVDAFDVLVELPADSAEPFYDTRRVSAHVDAFMATIDDLIPDGATMQSGIGGLPEAIMARLGHKHDLGIHTEVLGWGMAHLLGTDAVTNARKTHFPGESIYTIAFPEALGALTDNPTARLERAAIVLDPREIARNSQMRCVNAVLEVDLFGQGNAEMIGGANSTSFVPAR